jgi:hypothetical protein
MEDSKTALRPKNISNVKEIEMQSRSSGEKLTLYKSLSDAFSIQSLLVHQEILLPGAKRQVFTITARKKRFSTCFRGILLYGLIVSLWSYHLEILLAIVIKNDIHT